MRNSLKYGLAKDDSRVLTTQSTRGSRLIGGQHGFSLIEMLGVMTVLALLALALTPFLIKQFDRIAGEKETTQLRAFNQAFRRGVTITKTIPDENGWASMIATNLGISVDQVLNNGRRVPRLFLIDPLLEIGSLGAKLPYSQTITGSAVPASSSTRVMIISSISKPFSGIQINTKNLVSGSGLDPDTFSNIWNAVEGALPTGWSSFIWPGKGEDLKIERIHLEDMFLQLNLNIDPPGETCLKYAIDQFPQIVVPNTTNWYAFFIDGTQVGLYQRDSLQYSEILHKSKSFYSGFCSWQGAPLLGRTVSRPGPIDLQRAMDLFLGAANNRCALSGNSPVNTLSVFTEMTNYMYHYVKWGTAPTPWLGCTTEGHSAGPIGLGQPLRNAQSDLDSVTRGLICKQAQ
jgi:prepilin-type N-terminal cleavage/methylation domain-containing protein